MTFKRILTESAFGADDGTASTEMRAAVRSAAEQSDPAGYLGAVARLCTERVLVPVIAVATTVEEELDPKGRAGFVSDKEAEMSVVLLQATDGRRAMLVFTGLDSLQAWNPEARPVPVTIDLAARSAAADGAVALVIDVAGPHSLVIEGTVLSELAAGHRLVELAAGQFGWAVPNLAAR